MVHNNSTSNFHGIASRKKPQSAKGLTNEQIVLNDTAAALQQNGKYREAIPLYEKALEINRSPILLANMGISYEKLGQFEKANSLYDEVLKIAPNHPEALYNKACCESLQGKTQEALDLLKEAINFDSEFKKMAIHDEAFYEIKDLDTFKLLTS
jgi:tetratricopeptide (TPR) repeat protein